MEGKYVVAAAGVIGASAIEVVNLLVHGPNAMVTTAIIGAITFIVGLCFGRGTSSGT